MGLLSLALLAVLAVEPPAAELRPKDGALSVCHRNFDLDSSAKFTMSLAIRPLLALQDGGSMVVFAFGSGWFDGLRIIISPRAGQYAAGVNFARVKKGKDDDQVKSLYAGSPLFAPNANTSLTLTWDNETLRLYVNGKEAVHCGHTESFIHPKNRELQFCAGSWGLGYFPVQPFRARVWKRALTAEEVAGICAEDLKAMPKGKPLATAADLQKCYDRFANPDATTRRMFEERLAFAWLKERKLESATKYYRQTLPLKAEPYDGRWDYRTRWADALEAAGYAAQAAAERKALADELPEAARKPYVQPEAWTASVPEPKPGKPGKVFYVAPNGSDGAAGTKTSPFATLERAQDAVRRAKAAGLPDGGITVFFRGGTYPMTEAHEFDERDSGEPGKPIVWRAYKDEKPVFEGGWKVPALKPVTDPAALARLPEAAREHVRCCDVKAAGYTRLAPPEAYGGACGIRHPITELYAGMRRLEPARYPNDRFLRAKANGPDKASFVVEDGDLARWAHEPDLLATGFWTYLWLDMTVAAKSFDPTTGLFRAKDAPSLDLSMASGMPYFILNALCALDRPGEWYLDAKTGVLYVWPTEAGGELTLSSFDGYFLDVKDAHDLRFGGFAFLHGRFDAVRFEHCENIRFAKNVVRGFGRHALSANDCRRIRIAGNRFSDFGGRGVFLSGGDRATLTPAENIVSDNEIARVEHRQRTYAPGLQFDGCGMDAFRNRFHDMPSSAMRFEGNDFRIFSNTVERVLYESDDQGGIDIYRDPSYAGILISYNTFRDIGTPAGADDIAVCGQAGVRFDGNISGMTVYSNLFERCGHTGFGAVQVNGGRNNVICENTFVDCPRGVTIGHYGPEKWREVMDEFRFLYEGRIDIHKPPYATKYPGIATLDTQTDQVNWVIRNTLIRTPTVVSTGAPGTISAGNVFKEK